MFADLLTKVQQAVTHWSEFNLSYAGRVSLINSVIFGLEQYWCSTLLIPKGVVKMLNKFCRNFLWNSDVVHRKLVLKSWQSCCAPHQEGGFHIKEILSWNRCMLCKWIWSIHRNSEGLWASWNTVYNMKNTGFWEMQIKPQHSESWRSILHVRDALIKITGNIAAAKDTLESCTQKGKITLSKLYDVFRVRFAKVQWATTVWSKSVVPKHSYLMVLAMQRKLATIDQLNHRHICIVNRCILCKMASETHQHLFFQCSYSEAGWKKILLWMQVTGRSSNMRKELKWIVSRRARRHWQAGWYASCITALVYHLWEERNSRVFRDIEHDIDYVVRRVQTSVSARLLSANSKHLEEDILDKLNA